MVHGAITMLKIEGWALFALAVLFVAFNALGETMTLDENYNLVPYQDYSQRADVDREQRADVRGSLTLTESEQRAEVGVWFKFGNPVNQLKAWHNDLVKVDYIPEIQYSFASAEDGVSDVPYNNRTSSQDILSILKDTKPKNTVKALSDGVTASGVLKTIAVGAVAYYGYGQFIKRDRASEDEPDSGIRLQNGDVFISDEVAQGREVTAALGQGGDSFINISTFESSHEESEASE